MERTLFQKILFKKMLRTAAYLIGLGLLLASLYWIAAYLGAGQTLKIALLFGVFLLAGLIYYLSVREIPKENVAENNPSYAAELLQLLQSRPAKEDLKEKIPLLIQKCKKTTLFPLVNDLRMHVGHFSPTSHDYRFKNRVYSFDEGLSHYAGKLETMLASGKFVFDEPIYELYWRWFFYKGENIEVEYIHSNNVYDKFKYALFKSVKEEDYYFDVERGYSAFSSYETVKVMDEGLRLELAKAVQNNDRHTVGQIADKFLDESTNL